MKQKKVIAIALVAAAVVGGYFFAKKYKENKAVDEAKAAELAAAASTKPSTATPSILPGEPNGPVTTKMPVEAFVDEFNVSDKSSVEGTFDIYNSNF